uniref:Zn(2)-C6 fungal-type domain-containing protein n=1 Tax=Coccidioides posadasii RMSCC 3488 TaxID=454284 RepID=A0A0J6FTI4_COCPO|nr:hypothetical protein CPAG_08723 [Coccidioides posadasii RMSCC 3488]
MVYCGKPSKGCHRCRRRKIRCDQSEPSCGQCLRANHICPGYRDQLDLLFRDETPKVTRKARTTSKHAALGRFQSSVADQSSAIVEISRPEQVPPIPARPYQMTNGTDPFSSRPLSLDLKHQALCFFASSYAPPPRSFETDYLGYTPLGQNVIDNETLTICMTAVGLASLSNITKSRSMRLAAQEQYVHALPLIHGRLQNQEHARSIVTLDAVMLLGMFEVIACRGARSLHTWRNHMSGAIALLKLRLEDLPNFRAFIQVRAQIISGCLLSETYCPPLVGNLFENDRPSIPSAQIITEKLTGLLAKVANLRASIKEGVVSSQFEILSMALGLRDRLLSFAQSLEKVYPFHKAGDQDRQCAFLSPEFVYGIHFDVYPDFYAASIWNGYRAGRITLSAAISKYFSQLNKTSLHHPGWDEIKAKVGNDIREIQQLARDICASVPFTLGMIHWDSNTVSVKSTSTNALGGFYMLWPLYLAAEATDTMPEIQAWAARQLEYIGHSLGINQALWMASIIKEKSAIDEVLASESLADSDL